MHTRTQTHTECRHLGHMHMHPCTHRVSHSLKPSTDPTWPLCTPTHTITCLLCPPHMLVHKHPRCCLAPTCAPRNMVTWSPMPHPARQPQSSWHNYVSMSCTRIPSLQTLHIPRHSHPQACHSHPSPSHNLTQPNTLTSVHHT